MRWLREKFPAPGAGTRPPDHPAQRYTFELSWLFTLSYVNLLVSVDI